MANQALFRPQMTGPQPVAGEKIKRQDSPLLNAFDGVFADRVFAWAILACAVIVLAILVLIVWQLVSRSQLSWHAFGWKFFWGQDWDPVNDHYGALPFVYGTLVSSLLALIIAIPLAVGVGVFTTEMCPRWLRGPLSFTTELLAAIPSVIYGLWAIFVLVPILRSYVQPFLAKTLGWTGLFEGPPDRKSTRLNSSHVAISYAVFCLKKKMKLASKPWMTLTRLPSAAVAVSWRSVGLGTSAVHHPWLLLFGSADVWVVLSTLPIVASP